MKIAMFGTFDIGNFGDLLFPIVAERKLDLAPAELDRYSYRRMNADSWCYDVLALQDFPEHAEGYDLVLIGGGHLIHFVAEMAEGYGPTDRAIPHPLGFWWLPAVAARAMGLNVATHAVSCDGHLPRSADGLLAAFVESVDYLTVRDPVSQSRLEARSNSPASVAVVPDSVFSIPDLVRRDAATAAFQQFRVRAGLGERYIVVQPSYSLRRYHSDVLELAEAAKSRGWDVLELPIGFGIGNDVGFYAEGLGFKRIERWPDPLLLAEIIANSEAVIGISLHLSIVASAYGIPVYRTPYAADSKFIALDGLPNIRFLGKSGTFGGIADRVPDLTVAERHAEALNLHWEKLRALAGRPGCARSMPHYWHMLCAAPAFAAGDVPLGDRLRGLQTSLRAKRGRLSRRVQRRLRNLKPGA